MNNLYVFAIGGSGERVMRSLIMLLASGVTVNAKKVIPVFIDNDVTSDAYTKCCELLKYYSDTTENGGKVGAHTLYSYLHGQNVPSSFFKTEIGKPVTLNKAGNNIGNLSGIIGGINDDNPLYANLTEERDLLFTEDDLTMPLKIGFVGNPNIGSVVLNSLSLADKAFGGIMHDLSSGDGVFVVGSLFGGTGAAGFPLVVNTINKINEANRPLLGGVAVLPYFSVNSAENKTPKGTIDTKRWDVNSDSFDTKTRAALMYYDEYMRDMDFLYYVGDRDGKDVYDHVAGGSGQKNPADLVEVMAALSVVDFSKQEKGDNVKYKIPIWGLNKPSSGSSTSNVSGIKNSDLKKALVKFVMMKQIFKNENFLKEAINQQWDYAKRIGFTQEMRMSVIDQYRQGDFTWSWGLNNFIAKWTEWMNELGRGTNRQFLIFDEENGSINASNITSLFFSESGNGLAKVVEKKPLFVSRRMEALDAKVNEYLHEASIKLYKGKDATKIADEEKLPMMLNVISVALDNVIAERCVAM